MYTSWGSINGGTPVAYHEETSSGSIDSGVPAFLETSKSPACTAFGIPKFWVRVTFSAQNIDSSLHSGAGTATARRWHPGCG